MCQIFLNKNKCRKKSSRTGEITLIDFKSLKNLSLKDFFWPKQRCSFFSHSSVFQFTALCASVTSAVYWLGRAFLKNSWEPRESVTHHSLEILDKPIKTPLKKLPGKPVQRVPRADDAVFLQGSKEVWLEEILIKIAEVLKLQDVPAIQVQVVSLGSTYPDLRWSSCSVRTRKTDAGRLISTHLTRQGQKIPLTARQTSCRERPAWSRKETEILHGFRCFLKAAGAATGRAYDCWHTVCAHMCTRVGLMFVTAGVKLLSHIPRKRHLVNTKSGTLCNNCFTHTQKFGLAWCFNLWETLILLTLETS